MRGILEQGAGDGHALLLPAGEGDAFLADQGVVALREGEDHIVDGGSPGGGFDHFLVGHVAPNAIGDVLADGAGEEEGLLFHDADLLAQVMAGIVLELHAVQVDCAAGVFVKARQQVDQGGLARTGGTQQGDRLAGCTFKS